MSLLLAKTMAERVSGAPFIVGVVLLVLGVFVVLISTFVVKTILKSKSKPQNEQVEMSAEDKLKQDKYILIVRACALFVAIIGMALMLI
ncbi:MAG: hypothetical protein NC218_12660 [Acetobacter sp.]|nr:hypothetical protein [Acetobacter sp.]